MVEAKMCKLNVKQVQGVGNVQNIPNKKAYSAFG